MLDVGFSELLLIAVVALVVIGPKDLPVVVKHVAKFLRELRGLYHGLKGQMDQLMQEAGIDDLKQDMTTIIDMEGKPQKAFDVRELAALSAASAAAPSPLAGEGRDEGGSTLAAQSHHPLTQPSPARGEGLPVASLLPEKLHE